MASLKEDIEEFMGMPCEELVKCVEPEKPAKENAWDYFASEEYAKLLFYQAMQKQNEPAMPQLLANLIESYFTQPRILYYGCGNGMIALGLKNMGFDDITLADIPHRYNKFLQFISDKYKLGFKFIPIEAGNEYPLDSKYDVIICSEVLEVWEPEVTLLHLVEHLELFGYMYLCACKDADWVEGMGLKKAFQDENGVWKLFQKS